MIDSSWARNPEPADVAPLMPQHPLDRPYGQAHRPSIHAIPSIMTMDP